MKSVRKKINDYLSLVKFSHTVFALPFAMLGFFTASNTEDKEFSLQVLILVVLCMIFARNAAMAFNRFVDKNIDKKNPRTALREIPAGIISPGSALTFVIINAVLFIIATGFINKLTLFLSPVALLVILGYSLTKRFTSLSHLVLGLGLSLAPVGAYISVTGNFHILPVIFGLVVLTWVGGFDIIYSLQDHSFDSDNKLFSIPALVGQKNAMIISALIHSLSVIFVVLAGLMNSSGLLFWLGAILFAGLLTWEHLIVKPDDIKNIGMAFGTINSLAGVIFCSLAIADIYIKVLQ
jgi:4-hydroxybenzoate polyprenyltransferase